MFVRALTQSSRFFLARIFARLLVVGALLTVAGLVDVVEAQATDLTWGGLYRVEGVKIKNPELSGADSNKAYLLQHLVLAPKIVAADGLTIFGRFDILNDSSFGIDGNGRIQSVAGDVIGNGPGTVAPGTQGTNTNDSNAFARTQRAGMLAVTSLYVSWAQEFGQLVAGRVPFHYGLGTAYNSGSGLFDHYIDTKDMVGYKVILGNMSLFPMLAKVSEGQLGEEDDVNDYIFQFMYENPDTELALGILYQMRIGTFAGNDSPATIGGTGARNDGFRHTLVALYSTQKVGDFTIGLEADLLSGDTGMRTTTGQGVSLNAFGIAGQVKWAPAESKLNGLLRVGIASGDDPGTNDSYEGFIVNRNYDVGMLMFNHPLGQADFLRTGMIRNTAASVRNEIDSEGISNAFYVAPSLQYQWKDNFSFGGTFVYGMLNKEPLAAGSNTSTNLGYEVDVNLTYKPYERLTWITEAGFLFPGDAWKGGGAQVFENKMAYGVVTKAAIAF